MSVLVPVIDRLRARFAIGRDHRRAGREWPGIPAQRTRAHDSLVHHVVLEDTRPFTPLCVQRVGGEETQLFVEEVTVERRRYIVCRDEAEAAKDAADRRQWLAFEIDPGKVADEARFDGIFVLGTNARVTPLQAVLRYRDLIQVKALFKTTKSQCADGRSIILQ